MRPLVHTVVVQGPAVLTGLALGALLILATGAVVAREFSRQLTVLVAAKPTRGVDVGASEFIHRRIVAARDGGAGVLLVSAESDEVLALADRVAVMYRGRLVDARESAAVDPGQLGLLMGGVAAP